MYVQTHEGLGQVFEQHGLAQPEAVLFSITVVDENDEPLSGEKYVIYQKGSKIEEGILNKGRASFTKINKSGPFKFEVEGRACAIKQGAVLLTDEPGVEYGGTFFDWSLADNQSAIRADTFWKEYERERFKRPQGPASFWQHDHITRRSVKIREKYLREFPKISVIIKAIPVQIRVGPLVRYTSHNTAVIWVELETPGLVRVMYKKSQSKSQYEGIAHSATVRVGGRHYAAVPISGLSEDTAYNYTLQLAPLPTEGRIPVEESDFAKILPQLSKPILEDLKKQLRVCSVDNNEWLSFRTLRRRYDTDLRFAYGSCRKWPHDRTESEVAGPDVLEAMGTWLQKSKDRTKSWPRFLLFIGDQIYADDVGINHAVNIAMQRFASRVPGRGDMINGAWAGRFASRFTGLAAASMRKKYRIDNHALWKVPLEKKDTICDPFDKKYQPAGDTKAPGGADIAPVGKPITIHAADFAEFAFLYERAWSRPNPVRQVLANVPSFMIFDDHEITDDWNFHYKWVDIVYNPPCAADYWSETIADGLAAYWVYQGWGNLVPSQWSSDPRTKLLRTHQISGTDALPDLRRLLRDASPNARRLQQNKDARPRFPLDWDYKLPIESPLFYVLDCRMDRELVAGQTIAVGDRVVSGAQLSLLQSELQSTHDVVAFVVSPVPMLLPGLVAQGMITERVKIPIVDWNLVVVDESLRRGRDMEHWPANRSWFDLKKLLATLSKSSRSLRTVVALSGDVHFSYNMLGMLDKKDTAKELRIEGGRHDSRGMLHPYLLQLVCSPLKNQLDINTVKKLRMLVEDDSVVAGFKQTTPFNVQTVRLHLYSDKFSRREYSFEGMRLRLGGFSGIKNPAMTLLARNSVAIVDLRFEVKERGKNVFLVEQYLTDDSSPSIKFSYQMTNDGPKMTLPVFPK